MVLHISKLNKTAKKPSGDNLTWPDCLILILNVICFVSWFQNGMKHQNQMKTDKVVEKKFGFAEKLDWPNPRFLKPTVFKPKVLQQTYINKTVAFGF